MNLKEVTKENLRSKLQEVSADLNEALRERDLARLELGRAIVERNLAIASRNLIKSKGENKKHGKFH